MLTKNLKLSIAKTASAKLAGLDNFFIEPIPDLERRPEPRGLLNLFGLLSESAPVTSSVDFDKYELTQVPYKSKSIGDFYGAGGFRGKLFRDLVLDQTGYDIHDDYIPSHVLDDMIIKLDSAKIDRKKYDYLSSSEIKEFLKMLKSMKGKAILADY